MSWYRTAKDSQSLEDRIQQKIRSSPFFLALFKKHNVSLDSLKNCRFTVRPLDGSFAKADDKEIVLDSGLVESNKLFDSKFHFVAHEILHWLKRQLEKTHYFADPEEVESFTTAVAYRLYELQGKTPDPQSEIIREFVPYVGMMIKDKGKAIEFVKKLYTNAQKLLQELSLCNSSS